MLTPELIAQLPQEWREAAQWIATTNDDDVRVGRPLMIALLQALAVERAAVAEIAECLLFHGRLTCPGIHFIDVAGDFVCSEGMLTVADMEHDCPGCRTAEGCWADYARAEARKRLGVPEPEVTPDGN